MPGEEENKTDLNKGDGLTGDQVAELEADITSAVEAPKPAEGDPPGSPKKPEKPAEGTKPETKVVDPPPEPDPLSKMKPEELVKHAKGLQKAITEERGKRHKATDEGNEKLRQLSDQLAYVQGQLDAQNQAPAAKKTDPFEGKEDTDPITVADAKKLMADQVNQQAEAQTEADKIAIAGEVKRANEVWRASKEKAQGEYTEVKMGKGLDYDTVAARAIKAHKGNPGMAQAIEASDNPAKFLYQLGLSHPDSQKLLEGKYKTAAAEVIVKKLNTTKPKTIHSAGPTKVTTGLRDASLEDLNADPSVKDTDVMGELEKIEKEG